MTALPSTLALDTPADGATLIASRDRNDYTSIQTAVNTLIAALSGGTAGQVLKALTSTSVQYDTSVGGELGYTQFTAPVTVTGVTEAAPTDVVSAGALTFDGTAVMIEFFTPRVDVAAGGDCLFSLWGDGVDLGRIAQVGGSAASDLGPVFACRRLTPTAASHTYKITGRQSGGNATVNVGSGGVATFLPGFIRITKV